MADINLLIDSAWLQLGSWLEVLIANPEQQAALAVLVLLVFITWLWPPLRRRYCIKIPVTTDGKKRKIRPGVQTHLPEEVTAYVDSVNKLGDMARAFWTAVTFAVCESFAVALSLGIFQQGITLRESSTAAYTAFFAIVAAFFALAAGTLVWVATGWLWARAPKYIGRLREDWYSHRKMPNQISGWAGWELEDKTGLEQRKAYPSVKHNAFSCWKLLMKSRDGYGVCTDGKCHTSSHLEWHFWDTLMKHRIPHIYQYQVPTPDGAKNYRYLDFTLLNPKTGEPVLGIETDEPHHFTEPAPQMDFERELEIMAAVGIPIHRIPCAYWFRGLAPGDMKYPDKIKENQKRLLGVALRERDRIIKEKQARWRWLPRPLRRQ